MTKRLIILLTALLISTVCYAFQGMGPGPGVKSYSESAPEEDYVFRWADGNGVLSYNDLKWADGGTYAYQD